MTLHSSMCKWEIDVVYFVTEVVFVVRVACVPRDAAYHNGELLIYLILGITHTLIPVI